MISRVASSLSEFCIRHRRPVVVLILVATAAMGLTLTRIDGVAGVPPAQVCQGFIHGHRECASDVARCADDPGGH